MLIENREKAIELAEYIKETRLTIREVAEHFNMKKSTVWKYLTLVLREENPSLFNDVDSILKQHLEEFPERGGSSFKEKSLAAKEIVYNFMLANIEDINGESICKLGLSAMGEKLDMHRDTVSKYVKLLIAEGKIEKKRFKRNIWYKVKG